MMSLSLLIYFGGTKRSHSIVILYRSSSGSKTLSSIHLCVLHEYFSQEGNTTSSLFVAGFKEIL